MQQQLCASKEEVARLSSLNHSLTDESRSLREDLQLTGSELVFLKLQLNAIEQEASSFLKRDGLDKAFENALKRWKLDWEDVNGRYHARMHAQPAPSSSSPTAQGQILSHKRSMSEANLTRPGIGERSATFPAARSAAHDAASSEPPSPVEEAKDPTSEEAKPRTEPEAPKVSRWTAFWEALADAAGIVDYSKLLNDDEK